MDRRVLTGDQRRPVLIMVPGAVVTWTVQARLEMIMREPLPPLYVATINTPGYAPMADEYPAFDAAHEAWAYLAAEREREEDGAYDGAADAPGFSVTHAELRRLADGGAVYEGRLITGDREGGDSPGTVYGGTPGYDGDHDLGQAYTVTRVEHRDYPHYPGYLVDCEACEARCHCEPGSAECVYGGEHG